MAFRGAFSIFKEEIFDIFDILRNDSGIQGSSDYVIGLYLLNLKSTGRFENFTYNEEEFKNTLKEYIFSIQDSDFEIYKELFYDLEDVIQRVSSKTLLNIFERVDQFSFGTFVALYPSIFDEILFKISNADGKKSIGYLQPYELTKLIIDLAGLKNGHSIYNPFAGSCSFALPYEGKIYYEAQEINRYIWVIGTLRLLANNRFDSSNYTNDDSINNWNPNNKRFDIIVSNPPFLRIIDSEIEGEFGIIKNAEQLIIEKGIQNLTENGKLMIVVSNGFLFRSGAEEKLREQLIVKDWIEMVVSFPQGLFLSSGVQFNLLVINKNKELKGKVKFIDAKDFIVPKIKKPNKLQNFELIEAIKSNSSKFVKIITNEAVIQNDCNLSVGRYLLDNLDLKANEQLIKFREFSSIVSSINDIVLPGKVVKIENLKDDQLDYFLDTEKINVTEKAKNNRIISESCLLIAVRWKSLKPTYFEYTGTPIFISPDIAALRIDTTKLDIAYLVNEIQSDYVLNQVEAFRVGDVVPQIRINDLMDLKIKIPDYFSQGRFADSIREQQAKIKGLKEAFIIREELELNRKKNHLGVQSELQNQNNFLRHSIAGNLDNLSGAFTMLKDILENQIAKITPETLSFKQSPESSLNLENLLQIIQRDLAKITQDTKWNAMGDKNLNNLKMEKLDIVYFINEYFEEIQNRPSNNFIITLSILENELLDDEGNAITYYINANKDKLKDLFDNLIKNAVDHAFISNDKEKNLIDIQFMRSGDDSILFSVMNNGKRLPEDFTEEMYVRKGSKAGENPGSGYGGWLIDQIIKAHGGEIEEIIDEQGSRGIGGIWSTSIEFNLPILSVERNETV
jgi:type I restriction enzyme M protein